MHEELGAEKFQNGKLGFCMEIPSSPTAANEGRPSVATHVLEGASSSYPVLAGHQGRMGKNLAGPCASTPRTSGCQLASF